MNPVYGTTYTKDNEIRSLSPKLLEIGGECACAGLLEVAGIVEAMNLGAVGAEHDAVHARVALENVPEMGVVEPEERTEQHLVDDPVGNGNHCVASAQPDDLMYGPHSPLTYLIESLAARQLDSVRRIGPLLEQLGIVVLHAAKGLSLPFAAIEIC